jgi:dipeptidyl aminopeptidase/acylaminoacyl peptidase
MRSLVLLVLTAASAVAQATPSTDIWVVALRDSAGRQVLGAARNVTARGGYDNQPAWSPKGDAIYFSSQRGDAQNDIWRVDVANGVQARITSTAPESEYSPTVMPGGAALSVVKVERDSAQRLWRIPLDGSAASVILTDIRPVGYHAWGNDNTLGLFVLGGGGVPATFQVADARTGAAKVIARDIQRGIAKIPNASAISYVARVSNDESWLMRYDLASGDTTRIARMPPRVQDYAWTPSGVLLAGQGSQVFAWSAAAGWAPLGDLSAAGVTGITRMAVSPRGDMLAIVAQDKSP